MTGNKLGGVLFDATGTLIELREPVGETYARIAREFGVELSAEALDNAFARAFRSAPAMAFPGEAPGRIRELERHWWRAVVQHTIRPAREGVDDSSPFRDFEPFFEKLYATYSTSECWKAKPGSREILRILRAHDVATGVVSNFDHRLPLVLEELDFAGLYGSITLPSDAGVQKPHARIFRMALERIGFPASRVAFIGDDAIRDLSGAREVGMTALDAASLTTLEELPILLDLS